MDVFDTPQVTLLHRLKRRYRAFRHGPFVLGPEYAIVEAADIDRSVLLRGMRMTGEDRLLECQRLSQTAQLLAEAGRQARLDARNPDTNPSSQQQ